MIIVVIVALLATVSIPAYMRYIRQSKTVEAMDSLDKIKAGANAYFINERFDDTGKQLPHTFPGHIVETPAGGPTTCCNSPGNRCSTGLTVWNNAGWEDLKFIITDPHYYAYEFVGGNTDTDSYYSAYAYGDLDCDGTYSTFEIKGSVDKEGSIVIHGPVITREIE
jgi:Tfp pilus assembly major pilin PilA